MATATSDYDYRTRPVTSFAEHLSRTNTGPKHTRTPRLDCPRHPIHTPSIPTAPSPTPPNESPSAYCHPAASSVKNIGQAVSPGTPQVDASSPGEIPHRPSALHRRGHRILLSVARRLCCKTSPPDASSTRTQSHGREHGVLLRRPMASWLHTPAPNTYTPPRLL